MKLTKSNWPNPRTEHKLCKPKSPQPERFDSLRRGLRIRNRSEEFITEQNRRIS